MDILVSSIAEVPGVPCATPVGPQIGDLGFDKDGRSCEIQMMDWWEIVAYTWPGQGSLPLRKTRTIRVGPMDTSQRLHRRARCQAQEVSTADGVRVGYHRPGAGYKYRAQVQVLWLGRDECDACAYDLAEIESILENVEIAFKGYSACLIHHPYKYETNVVLSICTTKSQGSLGFIHDEVKVVAPIRDGLEDLSFLRATRQKHHHVGAECFHCAEVLFHPSVIGKEASGLRHVFPVLHGG